MTNNNYAKALCEVREVLKNTDDELINKIPQYFKDFIEKNYDRDYRAPQITTEKSLEEQELLDETFEIISIIYRNYWCDNEQRREYDEIIKRNEINYQNELAEKYNPDNLFKQEIIEEKIVEENNEAKNSLIEYKEPFFKRIFNKIKNFFASKK